MKKIILSLASLAILSNVIAQNSDVAKPLGKAVNNTAKIPVSTSKSVKKVRGAGNASKEIGTSTYDLQSNGSMSRRINNYGNGSLSAVWTFSTATGANSPYGDRGTGINTATAGVWGTNPTLRFENFRTGFPSLNSLGLKDYVINHNSASPGTFGWANTGVGTPFIQQSVVLNGPGLLVKDTSIWPKSAISGNYIHVINSNSNPYDTFRTKLYYSRSSDGGLTWPINCVPMPGIDTSDIYTISGEGYNIAANGPNVSVVFGDVMTNLLLLKSNDNGTTWIKDTVLDCGLPGNRNPYRFQSITTNSTTGVAQNIFSSDGSSSVIVDAEGTTHVIYSPAGGFIDSTLLAGGFYRPITFLNTLLYWNSDFATSSAIILDSLFDCDGNTDFDFGAEHNTSTAKGDRYGSQGSSNYSQMAISGSNIYCVYSAIMDGDTTADGDFNLQLAGQNYRDIFMVMSADKGETWGNRINISNTPHREDAFPSIAELVDGKVHLIWQSDDEPGTVLTNNDLDGDGNSIRYISIPETWIATHSTDGDYTCYNVNFIPESISNLDANGKEYYNVYPNPAFDLLNIKGDMIGKKITISNTLGQTLTAKTAMVQNNNAQVDISTLAAGVYVLSISDATKVVTQKFVKK
jgi:Secretion system C-terminal sorting domain